MITIFTPTYNRAHLLPNLYYSLQSQIDKRFEWIIVDDASSDNTQEVINKFLENDNSFEIISLKQSHGGKHRAINLGVKKARYDWFFIVDSDDIITNDAVDWIHNKIKSLPSENKLCAIAGAKVLRNGERIDGDLLLDKDSYRDLFIYENYKINAAGDMAEVWKTELLKAYPFPDYEGEYMCPEGVVWRSLAEAGYKVRYFNKSIYIFEYLEDGLTRTGGISRICKNFHYFCDNYRLIMKQNPRKYKVGHFFNFNYAAHKKRISIKERIALIGMNKLEFFEMYFFDLPVYVLKRITAKLSKKIINKG